MFYVCTECIDIKSKKTLDKNDFYHECKGTEEICEYNKFGVLYAI